MSITRSQHLLFFDDTVPIEVTPVCTPEPSFNPDTQSYRLSGQFFKKKKSVKKIFADLVEVDLSEPQKSCRCFCIFSF